MRFGSLQEKTDKLLLKMEPNVLYQPANKNFPAADMFWIEEEPVGEWETLGVCIQLILADKRPKPLSTYKSLFEHL